MLAAALRNKVSPDRPRIVPMAGWRRPAPGRDRSAEPLSPRRAPGVSGQAAGAGGLPLTAALLLRGCPLTGVGGGGG